MRPLTVIALVAIVGLLASQLPATAAKPPPEPDQVEVVNFPDPQTVTGFQLVGFTIATFDGDETRFGFTRACQTEFGPTSRMCSPEEVVRTVAIPEDLSGSAWVDPAAPNTADCSQWTNLATSGSAFRRSAAVLSEADPAGSLEG